MYPIMNIFLLELREWLWNYALAESEQAFDLVATPYNKSRARTALSIKTGLLTKQATKKVIQGSFRGKKWVSFPFPFAVHIQFNPKRFFTRNGVQLRGTFARRRPFLAHPLYPMCIIMCLQHAPSFAHIHCHSYPKTSFYTKQGFSFKVTTIGRLVQSSKQSYVEFLVTLYVQYKWELMTHIPGAICWSSVLLHFAKGQNGLHSIGNVHNTSDFQGHKGF